jgi:hypothetical protein
VPLSEVSVTMTTKSANSNVVSLETHPAWRSAQRRQHELMAAMRRHPAYQGRLTECHTDREDAVVLTLCAR